MNFAQAAAEHSKVLRKDVDKPSLDRAPACHDGVTHELLRVEVEIVGTVLYEGIQLAEGTFIEQEIDPLAGGQTSFFVLCFDTLLSPTQPRPGLVLTQYLYIG